MRFTAKVSNYIYHQFDELSDDELRQVVSDAEGLTTANCGWTEYRLRDAVIEMAKGELELRRELEERD